MMDVMMVVEMAAWMVESLVAELAVDWAAW